MKQKAVFLDRDGVINDNRKPVNRAEDLVLFPGVGKAIKLLQDNGFKVFVVTNQGGVGLGYMTEQDLKQVHDTMIKELSADEARVDDIRYCAHKPQSGCGCRKPEPGMILELADKYGVDVTQSYMVGDRDVDIQAGRRAGTQTVFIGQGHADADWVAPDLPTAVEIIIQDSRT